MLTKGELQYITQRYRKLRKTIGPEMIARMGRDENVRLRNEWLEEYRRFNDGV